MEFEGPYIVRTIKARLLRNANRAAVQRLDAAPCIVAVRQVVAEIVSDEGRKYSKDEKEQIAGDWSMDALFVWLGTYFYEDRFKNTHDPLRLKIWRMANGRPLLSDVQEVNSALTALYFEGFAWPS